MLVHVLNQRHLIQSYNMQATQRNMPANHGNVQATHGNMPATHAYNDWQVNLFDRMVSTTYHWLTHRIFLFSSMFNHKYTKEKTDIHAN